MVKTKNPSLFLYYEEKEVAELVYDLKKEAFELIYSADWLKKGFPLSPHLPLLEEFPAENIRKFLENLLPEGDALKTLARTLKIAPTNIYALIQIIGKDATGAFTISSENKPQKTSFRPLKKDELNKRIKERNTKPIAIWDGKPRLSLAGVQEKLAVTLREGQYGFGEGKLASTHILKFSRKGQHLVLNEFFCMKLAEKVGIPVAKVEIVKFSERVLQVERFDRVWESPDHVARKHIIDGCQALNVGPEFKYQRIVTAGPDKDNYFSPINVVNLSNFNKECIVPAKAQLQLLQWILFNLIIGNVDNHGKNISYFVSSKGYQITPSYDLLNISVYGDEYHQELAFRIGETFVLDEVKAFQLAELTMEMDLSPRFVANHLKKLCNAVLKSLNEIEMKGLSKPEQTFMSKLRKNIETRAEKFLKQAGLITSVAKSL